MILSVFSFFAVHMADGISQINLIMIFNVRSPITLPVIVICNFYQQQQTTMIFDADMLCSWRAFINQSLQSPKTYTVTNFSSSYIQRNRNIAKDHDNFIEPNSSTIHISNPTKCTKQVPKSCDTYRVPDPSAQIYTNHVIHSSRASPGASPQSPSINQPISIILQPQNNNNDPKEPPKRTIPQDLTSRKHYTR